MPLGSPFARTVSMRTLPLLALFLLFSPLFAQPPASDSEKHWSFQPRTSSTPPHFTDARHKTRVKNPVDAFILDKLVRAGLAPAPQAERTALIRRVTFDLTGLPPTPEEIDAFVK